MGWVKRVFTLIAVIVWATLAGSFFVSAWIETNALNEPVIAEGIYQYPYRAKGVVHFLTQEQWKIVRLSDVTRNGSFVLFAILAIIFNERRMRSKYGKGGDGAAQAVEFFQRWRAQLRGVRLRRRLVLVSSLPIEVCLERVGYRLFLEAGSVKGKLVGDRLKARKMISYRNSFQRVLTARFYGDGEGTLIKCDFSMAPFVAVFLAVWFGFAIIFSVIGLVFLISAVFFVRRLFFAEIGVPSVGVLLVVFGWLLLTSGIALSTFGEDELVAMLRYETKAEIEQGRHV